MPLFGYWSLYPLQLKNIPSMYQCPEQDVQCYQCVNYLGFLLFCRLTQHLLSSCAHLIAVPVSEALPSAKHTSSLPIFQPTNGYRPYRNTYNYHACEYSYKMTILVTIGCRISQLRSAKQQSGHTCYRSVEIIPCIDRHKCSSSHCQFNIPHVKTALAKHSSLLICNLRK